jgi:hypothetical protein
MGGTSRVTGDSQARFCEGLGVKFPGPTRPGHNRPERSGPKMCGVAEVLRNETEIVTEIL